MFQNRITSTLLLIFLVSFGGIAIYLTFHPDMKNTIWLSGVCSVAILGGIRWATYAKSRRMSALLLYLLIFDGAIHIILYILTRTVMA